MIIMIFVGLFLLPIPIKCKQCARFVQQRVLYGTLVVLHKVHYDIPSIHPNMPYSPFNAVILYFITLDIK